MILKLFYDNLGIARATIQGKTDIYYSCIDLDNKVSWCTCPRWVYDNNRPCNHILELLSNIDRSKMTSKRDQLDFLGTGSKLIDNLLGGGIPYGTVTAVFGKPMSGKSMFSYQVGLANIAKTQTKTLYLETEGLRQADLLRILYKFKDRWGLTDKLVKDNFEYKSMIGDYQLKPIQKLFQVFGYIPELEMSKGGRYTPKFRKCTPSIKEDQWSKYGMIIVDSLTDPLKTSVGSQTANLPARATITERFFGAIHEITARHNIAVIVNHHASIDPVVFYTDHGRPWGGDPVMYNSKFGIEFVDSTAKIRTDTGWGITARRVKLIRRPDDVVTGELHPINLKKDWGFTEES
jgi:RecA/RadA recombinase